jgi:hypothetical protein
MAIAGHDLLFLGRERRVGGVVVSLMVMMFHVIILQTLMFAAFSPSFCLLISYLARPYLT